MGPQSLAHSASVTERARTVIRRVLSLGLLVTAVASVQAVELRADPYRAAAAAGSVGTVTGRVYGEGRRPKMADQPLAGAAVILLPRSTEVLQKLEEIKRAARTSADDYRAAAPAILRVRRAYEKELWESGAADLVKATVVDAGGRFAVADLPAGDWLLIVTHTVTIAKHAGAASKQRGVYAPGTRLTGYQRVTVWLREVTVSSGSSTNVELTERGAWFAGVVEERAPDAGR
jgi:hypothetical protein